MLRPRTTRIRERSTVAIPATSRSLHRPTRPVAAALALVGATVLLLLPTGTPAQARPSAGAAAANPCADVLVLGARGSGQWAEGYDENRGYGPQVRIAVDRLVGDLRDSGLRVEEDPVDYPAEPMTTYAKNPSKYFAGVEQGVSWVQNRVSGFMATCRNARVALVGYSQGAMVMHRVLQRGVAGRQLGSWLGSGILIADSDRVPYDNTTNHGTAGAGTTGLAQRVPAQSGSSSTKLPTWAQSFVHSICNQGDSSCGDGVDNRVHTRYKGTPEVVEALERARETLEQQ